jgi:hypothetical protein
MRAAAGTAAGLAIVGAVLLSLSRARSPAHTMVLFDLPGALAEQVKKIGLIDADRPDQSIQIGLIGLNDT